MKRVLSVITSIIALPFRLMAGLLTRVFRPLSVRLDSSKWLSDLINQISSSMATQRGLLLMIGTALLVVSLLVHGLIIIILVTAADFNRNLYLLCIPSTMLHLGVLAGFTGTMLAIPLGQGYQDK